MASIAEMERNTLSENVKLGMTQRAKEGSWNGGLVCIATILDNPLYIGKIRWLQVENWDKKRRRGKNAIPIVVDGKHESIISDELWNIVKAQRQSKSFKQRQSNEPFLLSSILRCPDCDQGMVPSITTYTRKDGSKRKHRYYVCGVFHNKGSSACKANSIKAYDAEDAVINRITEFINDSAGFCQTIANINKDTVQSMEAFEQNLFPVPILQERLQKVSKSKNELEQKKNQLSVQLSSSDSKIIPPDVVRHLLDKYVHAFQQSTREKKKQLFQLLLNKITIKQSDGRSRTVDKVELNFNFSEFNLSKTFTLIHILYLESDKNEEYSTSLTESKDKIPLYLQIFLPLFMVRFTSIDPKRPVYLL
jgi:site-specific DNA recombinase